MYVRVHSLALSFLLSVLAACSGSTAGPSPASIVGTWQASKVQYVSTTGLGTVDLIAQGGSATLELNADHTFRYTCTPAGKPAEVLTGTWDVSDVLSLSMSPTNEMQFDASLSGNTLTLTGAYRDYDFNNDGMGEPARLNMTLTH
jgi:hypothetical protein